MAVLVAAAIGLVLGVFSVASKLGETSPVADSQPAVTVVPVDAPAPVAAAVVAETPVLPPAAPSASAASERAAAQARPPVPPPKHTIF